MVNSGLRKLFENSFAEFGRQNSHCSHPPTHNFQLFYCLQYLHFLRTSEADTFLLNVQICFFGLSPNLYLMLGYLFYLIESYHFSSGYRSLLVLRLQICSSFLASFFSLLAKSLYEQTFLLLIKSNLAIFCFMASIFFLI